MSQTRQAPSSQQKVTMVEAEEEEEHELTKEEEELEPCSPGNTAHLFTSKRNILGSLLDNDESKTEDNIESDDEDAAFFDYSDDEDAAFFEYDNGEAIPVQAAIDIKTKASDPVGKTRKRRPWSKRKPKRRARTKRK
jgi:hypothetical protein